jgi:pyrimidine-nucleoside phosphorylase
LGIQGDEEMNIVEIINKKKFNIELSKEEIYFAINGYTNKTIADYQMSSLLMAIFINSMTDTELKYLTQAMIESGDVIDTTGLVNTIDKHSTGGVGDKTSIVLMPLLACLGFQIFKLSGRGLGHTGGTVDKLESIDGYNTELDSEQVLEQVKKINIALIGQSQNLVPADKMLYALRDVTGTVDSIPLIASSIMSKKIASGAKTIMLDVKYGSGAFMKNADEAKELAAELIKIGKMFDRNVVAFITNMNEPLGHKIGNLLEVEEAVQTLKGKGPEDLTQLCIEIAAKALTQAFGQNHDEAIKQVVEKLNNGEAYQKFIELLDAQGSSEENLIKSLSTIKDVNVKEIMATRSGYINKIDSLAIGNAAVDLDAGRLSKESKIDPRTGLELIRKVGDKVEVNEVICKVFYTAQDINQISQKVQNGIEITDTLENPKELINDIIY